VLVWVDRLHRGMDVPFVMAPALLCRATGGVSLPSLCHGVRICFPLSSWSFFAKWSFSSCVMLLLSSEAGLALLLLKWFLSNLGASALRAAATAKLRYCSCPVIAAECWESPYILRWCFGVWRAARGSEARPAMRCFMAGREE
jgi:hypothetical protein